MSGQLTGIDRPGSDDLSLDYDLVTGQLSAQSWTGGQRNFFYDDDTGNLDHINFPGPGSLLYTYDGSLLKSDTWTGTVAGSVGRTYDNSFRVSTQSVNNANPVTYTYDNDDLLTGAALGSANLTLTRNASTGFGAGLLTGTTLGVVTDSYGYNSFGEVTSYSATVSGTPIYSVTYTRDSLGRIADKTETIDGVGPTTTYYKYDDAGRLWRVCATFNCSSMQAEYRYDDNGNRLSGGTVVSATYDEQQDRLQTATIGPTTYDYAYTANGELLTKTVGSATTTYTYDPLGNLTHVTLPNSTEIDYVIDGRDRRIGKKVSSTLVQGLLFDGQLTPVAELDGAGAVVGRFVYASKANIPDYVIRGATTYRILSDHLGSPRLVIDTSNGTVVQHTDYDEFGNILSETVDPGFTRLPFGFAGGIYDPQTGLTRFGARDYDPETGRWTAKDPIRFGAGESNLYVYVGNNPINSLDPSGRLELNAVGISATVGALSSLASALANDVTRPTDLLLAAAIGATSGAATGALGTVTIQNSVLILGLSGAFAGVSGNVIGTLLANVAAGRPFYCNLDAGSLLSSGVLGLAAGLASGATARAGADAYVQWMIATIIGGTEFVANQGSRPDPLFDCR